MSYTTFDPYSAWEWAIDPVATGKAWRKMRLEHHLSQGELSLIFEEAELGVGMSKAAISAVENGKHLPSLHHAFFFAALCDCPVEALVVTCGRSREADDHDQGSPFTILITMHLPSICTRRCSFFMVKCR